MPCGSGAQARMQVSAGERAGDKMQKGFKPRELSSAACSKHPGTLPCSSKAVPPPGVPGWRERRKMRQGKVVPADAAHASVGSSDRAHVGRTAP